MGAKRYQVFLEMYPEQLVEWHKSVRVSIRKLQKQIDGQLEGKASIRQAQKMHDLRELQNRLGQVIASEGLGVDKLKAYDKETFVFSVEAL